MKTRYVVLIIGLLCLFVSTASTAHDGRQYNRYAGNSLTAGVVVWGGSYAHSGYVGTLGYGPRYAVALMPHYGQAFGRHHDHAWHHDHKNRKKHGHRYERPGKHGRDHRNRDEYRHR